MAIKELTVEATHGCPLNCKFCSSKNSIYETKGSKLTPGEVKGFIDRFDPKTVRWSGGEPFLYLNQNYTQLPREREQIVTSNGFYTDRTLKMHEEFNEIRITILGKPETHEKLTRTNKSWERAIETIKKLIEKNREPTITSPLINHDQVSEVKEIARELGLKTRIAGLVPSNGVERPEEKTEYSHCSLGGKECMRENKRLVMPNGKVVKCAVDKRNYKCPYMNRE